MTDRDWLKLMFLFVAGVATSLAAYPGEALRPEIRIVAAALAAGCQPVLLALNPPGAKTPEEVAEAVERRSRRGKPKEAADDER